MRPAAPELDALALDARALVRSALDGDRRALIQLIHVHACSLRGVVCGIAGDGISDRQVDEVIGQMWLRLLDGEMSALRAWMASGADALSPWLAVRVGETARDRVLWIDAQPKTESRPSPSSESAMMRVEEVAARRGVNVNTVYGMIERGELPARRFGRVIRLARHVIVAFEQASVAPGGQKPCR